MSILQMDYVFSRMTFVYYFDFNRTMLKEYLGRHFSNVVHLEEDFG